MCIRFTRQLRSLALGLIASVVFFLPANEVAAFGSTVPVVQDSNTPDNLLENPSFENWNDGVPEQWQITIGARNGGNSPKSKVTKGDGPSLELSGDASTLCWHSVSQTIDATPDKVFRLTYSVKTEGVKRERNQHNNCFVAVFQKTKSGDLASRDFWQNNATEYVEVQKIFRVAPAASEIEISIFLSKTGKLNVKDLKLERLKPENSFDILVNDMRRHYSFFDHKKIDWERLSESYRKKAEGANSNADFVAVISAMLGELNDLHTWIVDGGKKTYCCKSSFDANFNFGFIDKNLENIVELDGFGVVGTTPEGFGYIRIRSLSGIDRDTLVAMIEAIETLVDKPGIILDLRRNGGGSEPIAQQIASIFTAEETVYGRQQFRSSESENRFYESGERKIYPSQRKQFTKPVVCLIGPGAVSSAEGFAMMMKALPNCTVIGKPTRGASGNPAPVALPNGIDVWYSRWMSLMPDGLPLKELVFNRMSRWNMVTMIQPIQKLWRF